jgi:hypothetical protein
MRQVVKSEILGSNQGRGINQIGGAADLRRRAGRGARSGGVAEWWSGGVVEFHKLARSPLLKNLLSEFWMLNC